jgi:16S rRNA (guanine527-N7)-methyltransferase
MPELQELALRYSLSPFQLSQLELLLETLEGDERAPTAVRERERALAVHVADALVALELEPLRSLHALGRAGVLADLGSGAGLPGAVLAVALPACEVSLVESERRKCEFIESMLARASITNAHAAWARAEEWGEGLGACELVTARALAPAPVVLEYAAPLLRLGGHLVEWRGHRDQREEQAAQRAAGELGMGLVEVRRVRPYEDSREHHLHLYRKAHPTPERFPRRAGAARKRPLS